MNISQVKKNVLKFFSFRGRLNREEYFSISLALLMFISIVLLFILYNFNFASLRGVTLGIVYALTLLFFFSLLTIKRLNDINCNVVVKVLVISAPFVMVGYVIKFDDSFPGVWLCFLMFSILSILKSYKSDNKHGPVPSKVEASNYAEFAGAFFIIIVVIGLFKGSIIYDKVKVGKTISALENYKCDTGKYPQNVDVIVPKYLDKLPDDFEKSFHYRILNEGKDFRILKFKLIPRYIVYNSETKRWSNGD